MSEPKPIDPFPSKEPNVNPLPDHVTRWHVLEYDPVSYGEIIWLEAGKVIRTISIFSGITAALIKFIITITGTKMEDSKPWYLSRTIIGAAIMAIVTILQLLKIIPVGTVDVTETTDQILGVIGYVSEFIGFILVLVGRIQATKTIG